MKARSCLSRTRILTLITAALALATAIACGQREQMASVSFKLPSRSIHIGLSQVSQANYGNWTGSCLSCVKDADWYFQTAQANGYTALALTNSAATGDAIVKAIQSEADHLRQTGGTLLITFSGHGAQMPPSNPSAQSWCAYDRQIIDKEILVVLLGIESNVRVVIISDSCYSGGLLKEGPSPTWISIESTTGVDWMERLLAVPRAVQDRIWGRDEAMYRRIMAAADEKIEGKTIRASVTLLAGAGADGVALQSVSGDHSTFTGSIVDTFSVGKELEKLFDDAKGKTQQQEPLQTPTLETVGVVLPEHFVLPIFPAS